jgi:hypothetical protein
MFPCKNKKNLLKEKPCKTFKKYKDYLSFREKMKKPLVLNTAEGLLPRASPCFWAYAPWGYNPEGEALRSRPSSPTFSDYLEFKLVMVTI